MLDSDDQRIIVTGGAGFIGSALVRFLVGTTNAKIFNVDRLTYAGNLDTVRDVEANPRYSFLKQDICDAAAIRSVFAQVQPTAVVHLAAETHVDRSIDGPSPFIKTNIVGTYTLLEAARTYWDALDDARKSSFRFLHVSTDEVYGSLGASGRFSETTPMSPNSPYSASKASSDHLVRAWHHTFGLPVLITNCSNNFGPYQFPEKLIPLLIVRGLQKKPMPIYGAGENVRDWLYVDDHVRALCTVLDHGKVGETYNIGADGERTNLQVVETVCDLLDELLADPPDERHRSLITFVPDRPGHDLRYAIDATKIKQDLGWRPEESFETAMRRTVQWYLENRWWYEGVMDKTYGGERLGLAGSSADRAEPVS